MTDSAGVKTRHNGPPRLAPMTSAPTPQLPSMTAVEPIPSPAQLAMTPTSAEHAGMPALDPSAYKISPFEFAPMWLFYLPVLFYVFWLALRFRGLVLPTVANPDLPFSGFVGESKRRVLDQMTGPSRSWIADYKAVRRTPGQFGLMKTIAALETAMSARRLSYPVVLKPDIGMRGAGVQLIKSREALGAYARDFPESGDIVLQRLVPEIGEAGAFYVRYPGEAQGRITSLTLKYFPFVVGDGKSTLKELIKADPRAGKLFHIYAHRFGGRLHTVPAPGERIKLAFAGNHSKGTLFRNGNDYITEAMTKRFDTIARALGEFYVGRFDVRFGDFAAFQRGEGFRIIEINGAGGESTHIWDSRTKLTEAWGTLMQQYKMIYEIGAMNRQRGFRTSSWRALYRAWRDELALSERYPMTH